MSPIAHQPCDTDINRNVSDSLHREDSRPAFSADTHVDSNSPPKKRPTTKARRTSINELPNECLYEIFRHLESGQDRSACACLCKRWLMLLSGIRNSEFDNGRIHPRQFATRVNNRGVELERCIIVRDEMDVQCASVAVGVSGRGGLRKLTIQGRNNPLTTIPNSCLSTIARSSPSLRVLSLRCLPSIDDEGLFQFTRECHSLEELSLQECPFISDSGLVAVAEGCPNLAGLTIQSCRNISDVGVASLMPKLKSICLQKCGFVTNKWLIAFMKAAIALRGLKLENCNRITLRGVINAISSSKLRSLSLAECSGIKDPSTKLPLHPPCNSIRTLEIRNCPGFGNTSLTAIGRMCLQLSSLDLNQVPDITNASLIPLVEDSRGSLTEVSIYGNLKVTDKVIIAIASFHGYSLKSLVLEGCKRISDASLMALAECCPGLHDLNVSKCSITYWGVGELSRGCQENLASLSVAECSMVTNRSIPALENMMGAGLVRLCIKGCTSINPVMIDRLKRNNRGCHVITD